MATAEPARVAVSLDGPRHRTRLRSGLLRPQQVHGPVDRCRIGLLATTALLLGGDVVELDVEVGPGATLELFDVAGTVAYDGRGRPARWDVRVRVGEGGRLRWSGAPFVVGDGTDVTRTVRLDLAVEARALIRETLVLGRAGQTGGRVRSRTEVTRAGAPVLVEDLDLDPARHRRLPGMLGPWRVLDSVLALGAPLPAASGEDLVRFALPEPGSVLLRHLGTELDRSPVHRAWAAAALDADNE
ncbi:urease accessory protein UreD [uncultured Friedmanniella sp.]|uniref:urease accessory protein UreD n=1 Tax=uncultured Friedmanniella sp. TaxID=335381 RepID=UPI0035CBF023